VLLTCKAWKVGEKRPAIRGRKPPKKSQNKRYYLWGTENGEQGWGDDYVDERECQK